MTEWTRVSRCVHSVVLVSTFLASVTTEGRNFRQEAEGYRESKLAAKADNKRPRSILKTDVEPKIVGGDASKVGDYPWMTALLDRDETDPFFAQFCGGALIHPYWVLTAAHCVEGASPEEIDVLIGALDLGALGQGERIEVVEIITHPDYDPISFNGDAALLRLATPSSAPVLRVNSDTLLEMPGLLATILGWGALDEAGNNYPDVLQEAQVPLVEFSTANAIWENTLTPKMIAAGNLSEGGVDSCSGDSGGPLLLMDFDGEWTLAGLTSFGDGCGQPESPGVYTRVSQIRPWLLNIVSPKYAAWELSTGVLGETRDADGDLRANFEEFAFGTNPMVPDASSLRAELVPAGPVFTFRRPMAAEAELEYTVHYKADIGDVPTVLGLEPQLLGSIPDETEEIIQASFPAGTRGFISMIVDRPVALAHAVRPAPFPGRAFSRIDGGMQQDTLGRFYQEFVFPGQPLGEPVNYRAESTAFDVVLEIYDTTDSIVLATASSNSAGGWDEQLTYTATSRPIIRVVSGNGGSGAFSLTAFTDVIPDGQIGLNGTVNGTLTSADEFDDLFDGQYYKRDYLLVLPSGFSGFVTINLISSEIDPFLILLDALTGQIIDQNDDVDADNGNYNSRLTLDISTNPEVLIRVSSSFELETGAFTLTTD